MKAGFIGLGNIGAPMASRLANPAFDLIVYDVFPEATKSFADKAKIAADPAEVGRHADVVGICVRDDAQVEAVLHGNGGLLEGLSEGKIVLVHSTVQPDTVHRLAGEARTRGARLIDAAVTGGGHVAAQGQLCVMAGGDDATIDAATPFLAAFASKIVRAGPISAGMILKAANNLVTMMAFIAARESYRVVEAGGGDTEQLTEVMTANGNLTPAMRQFMEFRKTGPERLGRDEYDAFQRRMGALTRKDLSVALAIAEKLDIQLPGTMAAKDLIEDAFIE